MAPSKNYVWVVSQPTDDEDGSSVPVVAFMSEEAAEAEAESISAKHGVEAFTAKVELKEGEASGSKKTKKETAPKKQTANAESKARKAIPDGVPEALQGLNLLFTGTFDGMDRETSKATAEKYGATVVNPNKLKDCDYVILGTKAGPKKLEEINDLGLETLNEAEFFELLKNGVSEEKRARLAAVEAEKADAPPAKKKQKK